MTENAYLHLGNAYIRANDKENARLAFEAARTNFDKQVREEALLNYALTTYETTSAFGESISAWSNSWKNSQTQRMLIKSRIIWPWNIWLLKITKWLTNLSKKLPVNEKILEAKQYILYQLGTEALLVRILIRQWIISPCLSKIFLSEFMPKVITGALKVFTD